MEKSELRILDANFNRAREGLRVCEDILRFFFEENVLTQRMKNLRHEIFEIIESCCGGKRLINYRDINSDTTKYANPDSEFSRDNIIDVFRSNLQRVQESLRVLEEVTKLNDISSSKNLKQIRFEVYGIEKGFYKIIDESFFSSNFNFGKFRLYPVLDLDFYNNNIENAVFDIISTGVKVLQLRGKKISDKDFFLIAKRLKEITSKEKVVLIINDRVDLSMAVDADGVHLGQKDLPASIVRKLIGKNKIIGISTHSLEQLKEANKLNVNYISVGPLFKTLTKSNLEPLGLDILDKIGPEINKPLIGIGGINSDNIERLYGKNLAGVSAISAIFSSGDIKFATKKLMDKVKHL